MPKSLPTQALLSRPTKSLPGENKDSSTMEPIEEAAVAGNCATQCARRRIMNMASLQPFRLPFPLTTPVSLSHSQQPLSRQLLINCLSEGEWREREHRTRRVNNLLPSFWRGSTAFKVRKFSFAPPLRIIIIAASHLLRDSSAFKS